MSDKEAFLAILSSEQDREFASQIAASLGYTDSHTFVGAPAEAAEYLAQEGVSPLYILIDIAERSFDVLPELDILAHQCQEETRVVVTGMVNDVRFYRELRQKGVIEYFTKPAKISDIRTALMHDHDTTRNGNSTIVTFMSAASGDGASTIAINVANTLATEYNKSVVIIDMDYQYGMIARNLDLPCPFGIKELFEHPERTVDSTLVERMLIPYGSNLKVIAAPMDLRILPPIKPELIKDVISILSRKFDYVIVDLPHIWSPWVASALVTASKNVLVSQLWLRSATHASRLLANWRDIEVAEEKIKLLINRSGSRFKEAISNVQFEQACSKKIDYYVMNDTKAVAHAENQGKTIIETATSPIVRQIKEITAELTGNRAPKVVATNTAAREDKGPTRLGPITRLFAK